jgi:hypothetical protein
MVIVSEQDPRDIVFSTVTSTPARQEPRRRSGIRATRRHEDQGCPERERSSFSLHFLDSSNVFAARCI